MRIPAIALLLVACDIEPPPQPVEVSKAGDYAVSKLFTQDGCTVYRFEDEGRPRYFVRCGSSDSATNEWSESCGKNCTRTETETVQTMVHP